MTEKSKIKLANSPRTFQGQIQNRTWYPLGDEQFREALVVRVKLGPGLQLRDNELGVIDLVCENDYWSDELRCDLVIAIEEVEVIESLSSSQELRAFPAEIQDEIAESNDCVDDLQISRRYMIARPGNQDGERVKVCEFPSESTVLVESERGEKLVELRNYNWWRL
jgi:hypothetical protein